MFSFPFTSEVTLVQHRSEGGYEQTGSRTRCICHWGEHVTGSGFFGRLTCIFFHWIQKIFTKNSIVNFWESEKEKELGHLNIERVQHRMAVSWPSPTRHTNRRDQIPGWLSGGIEQRHMLGSGYASWLTWLFLFCSIFSVVNFNHCKCLHVSIA